MDKNKKPKVKVIAVGKAKDYPGIKKIIEMNIIPLKNNNENKKFLIICIKS